MKKLIIFTVIILSTCLANAQWQQCPFYGGHIFSLAVNGTTVFAGAGLSLIKSDDYGSNWYVSNNGLPVNRSVLSIAIIGNEIYAGIDGNGMYKSTDNGASWNAINTGLPSYYTAYSILYSGNDIYVANSNTPHGGVYKSTDNGNSWNSVNNGIVDSTAFCFANDSTCIYCGSIMWGGVYKTIDNGASWITANTGLPPGSKVVSMVVKDTVVYAGIFSPGNGFRIYKSDDHGTIWSFCSSISSEIHKLAVCDDKIYLGTVDGVFYSTDGIVWTSFNYGLSNINVSTFEVYGSDIFAGTLGGVFLLSSGDSAWSSVNNGITANKINSFSNIGNNLFAGSEDAGIFLTTDYGNTWEARNNGITEYSIASTGVSGTDVYAANNFGVYKTSNYGNTWTTITNTGIPGGSTPYSIATFGSNIYIATSFGIFRSLNNGSSWSASNSGLSSLDVRSIAISETNDIYAAIFDVGVFMSTNNGSNWTNISNGFVGISNVNCLATCDNFVFAGLNIWNPPVITSNDYGTTWKIGTNGLNGHSIITLKTIGNSVLAGLNDGVFYTNNNGDVWNNMCQGLPFAEVTCIGRDDSCVYAGVHGHGVWKRPLSDFAIDFTGSKIIDLSSNLEVYPNPANDKLNIDLEEKATIEILNLQGQIIGTKSLTEKSNNLDLSNLVSGVYTLRITTDRGIAIRKLIKQ
jgi:photosystem II stability/assembly factor-like uncharacterized protein